MRRHHRVVAITTPLIALALIVLGTLGATAVGPRTVEPGVAQPHGRAERAVEVSRVRAPGYERGGPRQDRHGCGPRVGRTIEVLHGPVTMTLSAPDSDGHQVGDVRATTIPTTDASGAVIGRLDGVLTTTGVDVPGPGDEIRISTLIFTFGEDGTDQIVVGGSAIYPAQGPTLAQGAITTRPIQGGSGRFAGVTGSATSERFEDDSWRHVLYLGRGAPKIAVPDATGTCADARGPHAARPTFPGLQGAPIEEPGITREDLGRTLPASATGQELGLWHYTIPVGAELPPHTHPGPQIARIITGELEYTVIAGDGTVVSMDGTSTVIGPGTYVLRAGDTIIEDPDLEHYGANRGPGVVELIAATLYPEGAPLSNPLELASPAPAVSPEPVASQAG
jgi:quercetin dioxygenase-like cupin family protein